MQSNTSPRSRQMTASVAVDVMADYGAPIQMMQNNTATDANVLFNGGAVAFVVKASETIIFNTPILGTIESDQNLVVLA